MNDLELRALSIRCPLCSSGPQALCRDEQGNANRVPHVARVEAYQRGFVNPQAVTPTSQYHVTGINSRKESK